MIPSPLLTSSKLTFCDVPVCLFVQGYDIFTGSKGELNSTH